MYLEPAETCLEPAETCPEGGRETETRYARRAVPRLVSAKTCAEGGRETERGRGGTNLGNQRGEGGRND